MPPTGGPDDGLATPPPPPPPDQPSPKIECPSCGYSFIVGDIEVAVCPMCSEEVDTRTGRSRDDD